MRSLTPITVFVLLRSIAAHSDSFYWTDWYNRDDPSGQGDGEMTNMYGEICEFGKPIAIECRRVSDHLDYSLTGEVFVSGYDCTVDKGLGCRNKDQDDRKCFDYEVRFLCQDTCGRQCCPPPELLYCRVTDTCFNGNTDCPRGKICCKTQCQRPVCVEPVPCCCPELNNQIEYEDKPCRYNYDCDIRSEICCWSGYKYNYTLQCRPSVACPCTHTQKDLCCYSNYEGWVRPDPTCQYCTLDSQCPPSKVCCMQYNGCRQCLNGYINTCDGSNLLKIPDPQPAPLPNEKVIESEKGREYEA